MEEMGDSGKILAIGSHGDYVASIHRALWADPLLEG
jgi:hypothetical protein